MTDQKNDPLRAVAETLRGEPEKADALRSTLENMLVDSQIRARYGDTAYISVTQGVAGRHRRKRHCQSAGRRWRGPSGVGTREASLGLQLPRLMRTSPGTRGARCRGTGEASDTLLSNHRSYRDQQYGHGR